MQVTGPQSTLHRNAWRWLEWHRKQKAKGHKLRARFCYWRYLMNLESARKMSHWG